MSQDTQLQQAVLDELSWEPSVVAAHIGVAAASGVVTLSGHVASYAAKHAAEAATRRVKGVKAVAEELEVRLPMDTKRSDEAIAAAAVDRLAWDVSVPRDSVKVSVEKGWVTLSGEVDWFYQKDDAKQDVRRLWGVVGVSDQITIKPRVDTTNLSDDITHALHRSWFFNPDQVTVTAKGGRVKLTGTVRSWNERQTAASTAWSAPGATSVENDLVVV
jgi:osmotically-inducible protein OsmY